VCVCVCVVCVCGVCGVCVCVWCVCVCVVLVIQHAMRMRRIVICGLPRFKKISTLSHKWHDFRKRTQNVCFDAITRSV